MNVIEELTQKTGVEPGAVRSILHELGSLFTAASSENEASKPASKSKGKSQSKSAAIETPAVLPATPTMAPPPMAPPPLASTPPMVTPPIAPPSPAMESPTVIPSKSRKSKSKSAEQLQTAQQWQILAPDKSLVTVETSELLDWGVTATTQVKSESDNKWKLAGKFPELAHLFS